MKHVINDSSGDKGKKTCDNYTLGSLLFTHIFVRFFIFWFNLNSFHLSQDSLLVTFNNPLFYS
jgi:hypothetical protein